MNPRAVASASVVALAAAVACNRTNPDDFPVPPPKEECENLVAPEDFVAAPKSCSAFKSCVFAAGCTCSEPETPYQCPSMRPWAAVAHAPACGTFDGTFPAPTTGKCVATAPANDAIQYAGKDTVVPNRYHIGDGHFVQPAGHEQILHGPGVVSAFLADLILIPGTRFAVATDGGVRDNAVYSVDLDKLALDQPALVDTELFARPAQVDYGLAFVQPNHVYVSGAANGSVFGFTIDLATGALTRDANADLPMGKATFPVASQSAWYVGGIAATPAGDKLVVAPSVGETEVRVVDLATKKLTAIDIGAGKERFGIFADPNDVSGNTLWLSSYDPRQIVRVDLGTGTTTAAIPTGKNPEGIAFLDATTLVVSDSDDDVLRVIDTTTSQTKQTLQLRGDGLTGAQPSVLAYDATRKRLYAALSGVNAIGAYDVDTAQNAVLTPRGMIPTAWFPTALRLRQDGSLVITAAKGRGVGPVAGTTETPDATEGSIQLVPAPQDGDYPALTAIVTASRNKTPAEGFPTVECNGAPYDFPIPLTNTGAPSAQIEHIVYVIRENKTFDAIFGDMPGLNGDPKAVMSPGRMDEFWANARALAKAFTNFDNYYIAAEQSLQGHVWTSYGRSSDYIERTWSSSWGRGVRAPKAGIDRFFAAPAEGSLFVWAERNKIPYDDMGEIVGGGDQGFDPNYPGLVFSQTTPDTEKACYIAARARAVCDLKAISYVVLPNDHTKGDSPGAPTPELMIAVNDVGTGMIVDALSRSPMWAKTLVIFTEDDPQEGDDHVSGHRTPLFMASPWIKRGYVSKTNISSASIHKLIANILAKPYQSESIASAAIPFDAFTSTPDYSGYLHKPLQTKVSCNPAKGWSSGPTDGWDFSQPDNQPGLDEAVERRMRAIAKP